jgi:hypothetical protein
LKSSLTDVSILRFDRNSSSQVDIVDSLLLMKNSTMTRIRDRSQEALNRREQTFDVSINYIFSQFEQMKMQTNEKMNSAMKRVMIALILSREEA